MRGSPLTGASYGHFEISRAERHQSEREDQLISHSQRRRELVDEDDEAQEHPPPQAGHPDEDHDHQRIANINGCIGKGTMEGSGPPQSSKLLVFEGMAS